MFENEWSVLSPELCGGKSFQSERVDSFTPQVRQDTLSPVTIVTTPVINNLIVLPSDFVFMHHALLKIF